MLPGSLEFWNSPLFRRVGCFRRRAQPGCEPARRHREKRGRPAWLRVLALAAGVALGGSLSAQVSRLESAPEGQLESGVPPFAVFGPEALGLSLPPTDIHLMPDGRILLFATGQIVLGDGVRWDTFRQAGTKPLSTLEVAVDRAGQIFMGTPGGFSRVDFRADGSWELVKAGSWPAEENSTRSVPQRVIAVGDDWFWNSGSGSVIVWSPGRTARIAAPQANMVERVFRFQENLYLSDRTEGNLFRMDGGEMVLIRSGQIFSANDAITCAQPYDEHSLLVGTYGRGLQLFDGREVRPLLRHGVLADGLRINDLCQTEGNLYAAAVENYGIVFFDHQGRIIQALDRSLDHRIARVKRLLPAPGGVIWAVLEEGVVRVEFPGRVSNYEPFIGSGVTTAHPFRHQGRLWMMADGKTSRAVYDQGGRLTGLAEDTPADRYVFAFSTAPGALIAGTDHGAYFRGESGWVLFAPETDNLRILETAAHDGRWLYGAKDEIGWLQVVAGDVTIERIPVPGLGNVFNTCVDRTGSVWLELGSGRVGRIRIAQGRPVVETFDSRDGVPGAWAQVFEIGGTIGFNVADEILRFEETTRRFLPDTTFATKYPGLTEIVGRPGVDALGRLWITANGGVQILENYEGRWRNLQEKMPTGLLPYYFTFESNGVVWMNLDRHLVRFDPSLPVAQPVPLRAIITHVNLVASNRTLFGVDRDFPALDYSDNSLDVHFMAPGNPFTAPVAFEVMLEGSGTDWVSNGGTGSAVFNRLKEGNYTLHVRPRLGDTVGTEAQLAFVIRPPWYRSPLAYLLYALFALGLVLFATWLITFLQRRETVRLERLVALRTGELKESNLLLARQVEEIRMLSQAIAQSPVSVIITQPDGKVVFANPRASELTGYPLLELIGQNTRRLRSDLLTKELLDELAATVQQGGSWHGQLANRRKDGTTVHVRTTISPIRNPEGQIRLHLVLEEDISEWLADQERRQRLEAQLFQSQKLESIGTLAGGIAHDFNNILTGILGYCELASFDAPKGSELYTQLQGIRAAGLRAKDLVAGILTFSRQGTTELVPLNLGVPVAEALRLIRASTPATISISSQLEVGTVRADSTQIQQVVLNLCTNAVHAIGDKPGRIEVSLQRVQVDEDLAAEVPDLVAGACMRLTVKDTGQGMAPATVNRIFDPFFTTKEQGKGTGLGLSIVQGILAGHHGALRVLSQLGGGSTFELFFPLCPEAAPPAVADGPVPRGDAQEILVVDDEPSVAAFVSVRLQQLGYRVVTVGDPREALAAWRAAPERFQAIVTDLTMPHLTGVDLIHRIRALGRVVPAVLITGYGRDAGGAQLAALPRCQVLYKPFSGEDLARLLNRAMTTGVGSAEPGGPTAPRDSRPPI